MRKPSKKPDWQKKIANERIRILFSLADKEFKKRPDRSNRYVELSRRIGKRYNVKFNKNLKRKFCRKCLAYTKPGVNSRVRVSKGILTIECLECGKIVRMPCINKGK